MVRATRGSRSGPMTMSATTAITISSENPTSNTEGERIVQKKKPGPLPASGSGRRPLQVLALSLTSPSMVRPPSWDWGEGPLSECLSAEESFMPSLNPRTAPPRSAPMLRSFFVPKTSKTISSTTSQCQMLQVPMALPFRAFQHRAQGFRAADDMDVQMIHLLPTHTSGVDDDAKTVGRPLLARQARRHGEDLAQYRLVVQLAIRERINVFLRDDHEMHRGERMDVMEGENLGVLVDFSTGDFSPDDPAEDAVFRVHPYFRSTFARRLSARAAFSSIPEIPSRRRSSASTSAGRKSYCASMIRQ